MKKTETKKFTPEELSKIELVKLNMERLRKSTTYGYSLFAKPEITRYVR